ncbi:MAG: 7TM diverse intracellular signaling domain-containing protein [Agriterribacter sp.]
MVNKAINILFRLSITVFLCGATLQMNAQVINVGKCDSIPHYLITNSMSVLKTSTPLNIEDVVKPNAGFSIPVNEPVHVFEYDPYFYWFRIIIKNDQPQSRNIMLLMAPVGIYDAQLYQHNKQSWESVARAGLRYPFKERSYQFAHHVFPFTLPANSTDTLYLNVNASNVYKSFGFALLTPKELKMFENRIYFVFGIIVGLLILFFFLNVSLFVAIKEKLHLWYALYISLLFLIVMKNDHLDQQFLGLDSEKAFRLTPYMAIGSLAIAVLMHVSQLFLKTTLSRSKFLYNTSTILKVHVIIAAIVHAFVFKYSDSSRVESLVFTWAKLSTLLGICMIIVNCIYCIRKGLGSAAFILSGSVVFLIGSVQRLYFASTLSFLFPPTTFHIGIIVETFVVTLGLIYRYWVVRRREAALREISAGDISKDLHDNVGNTFALVKVYLNTIDATDNPARETIENTKIEVNKAIKAVREMATTLKNQTEEDHGLIPQLEDIKKAYKKAGIDIRLSIMGKPIRIEGVKLRVLIGTINGILQNVLHHANATLIEITLNFTAEYLTLSIADNGVGFEVTDEIMKSRGISNIRNRCKSLNAKCNLISKPGEGAAFRIEMQL